MADKQFDLFGGEPPAQPVLRVPFVRGSDTSRDAAESMRAHVTVLERVVFDEVKRTGNATCDEVEIAAGLSHQTTSARLRGLVLKGLVRDSGRRRNTRTGRKAVVYVAAVGA